MNIYQKAIKVKKVCEAQKSCYNCKYFNDCNKSIIFFYSPMKENIKTVAKTIKEENWKVN